MDKLEPPQSFSFEGNVSQSWKLWLKHFEFYLTATKKDVKNDKVKTSVLMTCIGQKGREIYETFNFDNPGDEMRLACVFLNTATQERTSLCFVISFLHIDNMKDKTSMTSSQN